MLINSRYLNFIFQEYLTMFNQAIKSAVIFSMHFILPRDIPQ